MAARAHEVEADEGVVMNRALRARHALVWPIVLLIAVAGVLFGVMIKPSVPAQALDAIPDVSTGSEGASR